MWARVRAAQGIRHTPCPNARFDAADLRVQSWHVEHKVERGGEDEREKETERERA